MATTTSRLLQLLSLLQTRRDWPGSALAARLDVSDRTVRRDIDRLREMGYRIEAAMGPDGGYRLAAGSELPPLLFDDDQTVAVAVALRTASGLGREIEEGATRALATIRQVMPSRLRRRLDALEVTTLSGRGGSASPGDVSTEVLALLANAVRDREVLRFDYATPGAIPEDLEASAPRRAEPHRIATSQGRWYLLAWDLDRQDWRTFRIDRMTPRTPNGPRFTPREVPGGDVGAFISARFKGSDVDAWPCRGTVVLHLPAHAVQPYAGDGIVQAIDDHRCTLEDSAWSWGALAASFGRFDVPLEVVSPPELAEAFAGLAARYAATGRGDASSTAERSASSR